MSTEDETTEDRSKFDCNICLESATDPVVSYCGHLYCWPCLHQWLETKPQNPLCPVCKSVISKEKVIPIYGKSGDKVDPRTKAPPRPSGQRTEDPSGGQEQPFAFPWLQNGVHANVHFSFAFGLFPFSFMFGPQQNEQLDDNQRQNELMSNLFLGLGFGFILWLIFI
ncbi:hypothetical protein M3Y94_00672000 [Aphelenchoides besseyi]|nr:hypothetical protein M3Y94_00672000 [Aphelenchoides besseyi]KAI6231350.1 Zinc finger domain containing protein [Aphelenchoides besseyi]